MGMSKTHWRRLAICLIRMRLRPSNSLTPRSWQMGPNLYILAFPKVPESAYAATSRNLRSEAGNAATSKVGDKPQCNLRILAGCLSIGNTTTTATAKGRRIPRLLKGYHSACSYQRNNRQLIEAVDEGTLFLTNFNGILEAASGWVFCRRIWQRGRNSWLPKLHELLHQSPHGIAGCPYTSSHRRLPAIFDVSAWRQF